MQSLGLLNYCLIAIFSLSYLGIIFEHTIRISKTAIALFSAIVLWSVFVIATPAPMLHDLGHFGEYVYDTGQVFFFLLAAMTIVELIDSHQGFIWITKFIKTNSKAKLLVIVSVLSFFLSSILDNLTTTILMVTLLKKLIPAKEDRFIPACMVVIAANSGGAWTPIGDVTTTMLWIEGKISTLQTMKSLFIPSLLSMLVPLMLLMPKARGRLEKKKLDFQKAEPGSLIILILGLLGLVMIPVFKSITGLPPFMGALLALAVLWMVTDIIHQQKETRSHLKVPFILSRLDMTSIMFFMGILLSVSLLQEADLLNRLAMWLNGHMSIDSIALPGVFGVVSAIIDNVPLVAASMGMYSNVPQDTIFWQQIAYAAGVGGSMLIIGSSSGVALMGLERVSFIDYCKKISLPALAGFLVGLLYLAVV